MAEMIPAAPPAKAHPFEKDLFEKFKRTPANWKIYPQFFVEKFPDDVRPRELDFVILIPKKFTVIYLEAKTGAYRYEGRQWYRGTSKSARQVPERPSPPEQANSGMFALKNRFERFLASNNSQGEFDPELLLKFGCAVAFRDYEAAADEDLSEDVTKLATLIGRGRLNDGNRLVESLSIYATALRTSKDGTIDSDGWSPDDQRYAENQRMALEAMLNPSVSITRAGFFRSDLNTLLPQILEPSVSQTRALNLIGRRERCLIDGAAGTGKTVLAMEVARAKCEEEGKSVALVCSNPNLSDRFALWSETLSRDKCGKVIAGTPASLLSRAFVEDEVFAYMHQERLADSPGLEATLKLGDLDDRWGKFVDDTLADLDDPAVFDYLIIDEAQNLCDDVFLKLFDKLLKCGLANGEWSMFGDFENQVIVTPRRRNDMNTAKALDDFGAEASEVVLTTNCRNTFEIAETIAKVTGIECPTRPGLYGPLVDFKYFDSPERLSELLEQQLDEWAECGFESSQIIMLTSGDTGSFDADHEYGRWKLVNIDEDRLRPKDQPNDPIRISADIVPSVRFSDVFDFQGLESDLGILIMPSTDGQTTVSGVNTLPDYDHLTRILYTGMSRISAMLVVIADDGYQTFLEPPGL